MCARPTTVPGRGSGSLVMITGLGTRLIVPSQNRFNLNIRKCPSLPVPDPITVLTASSENKFEMQL